MVETKEKKVRPSKKAILREIAETDTPRLKKGEFNLGSLERTNIQNLELIALLLKDWIRGGFVHCAIWTMHFLREIIKCLEHLKKSSKKKKKKKKGL